MAIHDRNSLPYRLGTIEELYKIGVMNEAPDYVRMMGINMTSDSLPADTQKDLWNVSGNRTFIETADTINIVSDSIQDDVGGTGAYNLILIGLDSNGDHQVERIDINGTTTVTTTLDFLDLRRVDVRACGNTNSNVGSITFTGTATGDTLALMLPEEGITTNSHFVVPNGFIAYTRSILLSISQPTGTSIKEARVIMKQSWPSVVSGRTDFKYPLCYLGSRGTGALYIERPYSAWGMCPGTRVNLTVKAHSAATQVKGEMQILLIKQNPPDFFY